MSFPWDVLGIDATNDQRAIKRAYAARLKVSRPDDGDGSAFQELHEAYKFAVMLARQGAAAPDDGPGHSGAQDGDAPPASSDGQSHVADQTASLAAVNAAITQDARLAAMAGDAGAAPGQAEPMRLNAETMIEAFGPPDRDDGTRVSWDIDLTLAPSGEPVPVTPENPAFREPLGLLDQLLASSQNLHMLANWQPLERHMAALGFDEQKQLSERVLRRVIAHQKSCRGKNGRYRRLGAKVLVWLDGLMGWRTGYYDLLDRFPQDELAFLLDLPDTNPVQHANHGLRGGGALFQVAEPRPEHNSVMQLASWLRRIGAFLIDIVPLAFLLLLLPYMIWQELPPRPMTLLFACYVVVTGVTEGLTGNASFGKRAMGIKVMDRYLGKIGMGLSLWRAASLFLCMAALEVATSLWLGFERPNYLTHVLPFQLCFWFTEGRLPQDLISRTLVVEKN